MIHLKDLRWALPLAFGLLLAAPTGALGQEAGAQGWVDIEQLSTMRVTMTSVRGKPVREQPGIVSVVTARQIREMGARDLMDILRMVPGFYFGQDVVGVIGPSFRGLWAHEGKLQLIVDGMEFNETLFGTIQLGHHIPADAIERVEIIRGPGSAIYGGTAELGVVRITTKGADQEGGYAVLTPSATGSRVARDYAAGIGQTGGDWRVSANAFLTNNFRSNQPYVSLAGERVDMTRDSDMGSRMLTAGLGWKALNVRVLHDLYKIDDRVAFGAPLAETVPISFESLFLSADYEYKVHDRLTLTPLFSYRNQVPWKTGGTGSFEVTSTRYTTSLTAVADLSDSAVVRTGIDYYRDAAKAADTAVYGVAPATFYGGTSDQVSYNVWSPYAQLDWDAAWMNVSVGGRYEHHTRVPGHFVPRVAVTKAWTRFHMKALFNQAYRTPNINIFNYPKSGAVNAETTTTFEVEGGFVVGRGLSVVGNLFHQRLCDPIVYTVDPVTAEPSYTNDREIGNVGAEFEVRYSQPRLSAYASYSGYLLTQNTVTAHQSGDAGVFIGIPSHKVTASATWYAVARLTWNLNAAYVAGLRAYSVASTLPQALDPLLLLNSYAEYRWNTVALGIGAANLLDADQPIAQPYNGGSGPIPLKGREVYAKITVGF